MGESDKTPRRSTKKARCAIYTRKSSDFEFVAGKLRDGRLVNRAEGVARFSVAAISGGFVAGGPGFEPGLTESESSIES